MNLRLTYRVVRGTLDYWCCASEQPTPRTSRSFFWIL